MPSGTLEIFLVSAHGIKGGDLFSKTDAYAVVTCGSQSQKSNVARNQGSNPTWNQKFVFSVEDGVSEVVVKIMDEDFMTADDELGTVRVPLAGVLRAGKVATTPYGIVQKNGKFKGDVKLSLDYTPKTQNSSEGSIYNSTHGYHAPSHGRISEGPYGSGSTGGWTQGSY